MPTKMRLQRHGKKRSAFYHIVIADNRAPRDGKFIEKIGTYNPNSNPATIDLEFDKALSWIKTGASPTDTVRAILSYEGVLYKNHLDRGVLKGALTEAEATKKFEAWKTEKQNKIQSKIEDVTKGLSDARKSALKAEEEVSKKREQDILAKQSALADEARKAAEATTETAVEGEEVTAESAADAPSAEAAPEAEVKSEEAPAAEATAEVKAEEAPAEADTKEEVAEVKAEAAKEDNPVAEAKAEVADAEKKEESAEDSEEKA